MQTNKSSTFCCVLKHATGLPWRSVRCVQKMKMWMLFIVLHIKRRNRISREHHSILYILHFMMTNIKSRIRLHLVIYLRSEQRSVFGIPSEINIQAHFYSTPRMIFRNAKIWWTWIMCGLDHEDMVSLTTSAV